MRFLGHPVWLLFVCAAVPGWAQTTQGLISGRLQNSRSGEPVAGATLFYSSAATSSTGTARTDAAGYYYLPLLSPGFYRVRASAPAYQDQELYNLEVPVAGRLEVNFRMRPLNDVWEAGETHSVFLPGSKTIVTFYGPDIDPSRSGSFEGQSGRLGAMTSTLSQVIDPSQLQYLPLAGRDAYAMILTQPGTTADSGSTRSLGLSAAGQRPSASNFMLDGLENNNYLVTGPLAALPPEDLQEYRVSTGLFSAEYGRTSGYLANAVTRSGGNDFHGIGYLYGKNEALNANGFQANRLGLRRAPLKEQQFGIGVGGPVLRDRLFFFGAFDRLRSRARQDPVTLALPAPGFAADFAAAGSNARKLLQQFPAPAATPDSRRPYIGSLTVAPPVSVDRSLALARVDYRRGSDQVMARLALNRLGRPDFLWSPYPDFISALDDRTDSVALSWIRSVRAGLTNEAKAGYGIDRLDWNRPHPEIPTLASGDGALLPGSPAFYAYRNHTSSWQFLDSIVWTRGRHVWTFGAGLLRNGSSGYLTAGRDGFYSFGNLIRFGIDQPSFFSASVARGTNVQPAFDRDYRYRQPFFFAQDAVRLTARLSFNWGVRYEYYGAPRSVGRAAEIVVAPGAGATLAQQIAGASLVTGARDLYSASRRGWAYRAGAAYDLTGRGRTLLRAGSGIFYDRPFDNLWQDIRNNSFQVPLFPLRGQFDYLAPVASVLASFPPAPDTDFPALTMFASQARNGYSQNYFYGLQQRIAENWSFEITGTGAVTHHLITTDVVNRTNTTTQLSGRLNEALPDINYRAGQGFSNYQALIAAARYRASFAQFQAAYTWSHAIDNQSEPLAGDFFDLSFTRITSGAGPAAIAAFSRQFDPLSDRGNSDFDQRHNLVFFSIWNLPGRWRFSQLAAFRSGFPYTVYAAGGGVPVPGQGIVLNNRADLLDADHAVLANPADIPGGKMLLNPAAFAAPGSSVLGSSGRNAFRGPGLFNVDVSLSRSFGFRRLGEAGRLTVRADAYNFLNHANLGDPNSTFGDAAFGQALYGRRGKDTGFPAVVPFSETARQVQILFRAEW